MILGIDFGTCYSSVSVMRGDTVYTDLIKEDNPLGIPSQYLYKNGKEYFGSDCNRTNDKKQIVKEMKKIVRSSNLGINHPIKCNGMEQTVGEIIKKYLSYLIERTVSSAKSKKDLIDNTEIEEITITAPVGTDSSSMMSAYKKFLKNTLVEITELDPEHVHVREEPTAAAISYLFQNQLDKDYDGAQNILTFDLGGGTLDTCIIEYVKYNECVIKAKRGDLNLGGNDWDEAFSDYVLNELDLSLKNSEEEYRFNESIIEAKIGLSSNEDYDFLFEDSDYEDHTLKVTRDDFENATKKLLDRAMETLRALLRDYGRKKIDKVILVGGGSNMPQIRNRIYSEMSELIRKEQIELYDPSKAISKGAAINSQFEFSSGYGTYGNTKIEEIATHTYGINLFPNRHANKIKIKNMIFKGDKFRNGIIKARLDTYIFPASDEYRFNIKLEVYESDISMKDCDSDGFSELGIGERPSGLEITIPIPEEYVGHARQFKVIPILILDTDGILNIEITDLSNNSLKHAEIKLDNEVFTLSRKE